MNICTSELILQKTCVPELTGSKSHYKQTLSFQSYLYLINFHCISLGWSVSCHQHFSVVVISRLFSGRTCISACCTCSFFSAAQPVPQGNVQVVPGSTRPQLVVKGQQGVQPSMGNYYTSVLSNASSVISSSGESKLYVEPQEPCSPEKSHHLQEPHPMLFGWGL